ncbi:hypothetical protein HDU82_008968 [Entophlyctis luteolus]|nr:hypothetical protein HDU82_008968 [Entophlyctis luteolus]
MNEFQPQLFPCIAAPVAALGVLFNAFLIMSNVVHLPSLPSSSFLAFWFSFWDSINLLSILTVILPSILGNEPSTAYPVDNQIITTPVSCQIHGTIELAASLTSMCICSGLTYLRYSVIVLRRSPPRSFAPVFVAASSAAMLGLALYPAIAGSAGTIYTLRGSRMYCMTQWDRVPSFTGVCLAVLAVPLCSIGYAYTHIFLKITRLQRQVVMSLPLAAKEKESRDFRATNDRECLDEKQHRLLFHTIAIVMSFLAGWIPYSALVLQEVGTGAPASPLFDFLATICVFAMLASNPLMILAFDKPIQDNAKQFWMCWLRK